MKIAENCITHNVLTILVYILIAVFGFYCFQSLPLALMPDMDLPVAIVYATYAGAGPELSLIHIYSWCSYAGKRRCRRRT